VFSQFEFLGNEAHAIGDIGRIGLFRKPTTSAGWAPEFDDKTAGSALWRDTLTAILLPSRHL
jgi:hypothetical protein